MGQLNTTDDTLNADDDKIMNQETQYLLSIPGMRESILEGLKGPVEECTEELDW